MLRASPPGVSILLPVFNGGRYLASAMRSLLLQSYGDFELIAIDDGSTDGSLDVLRRFAVEDARIWVVTRPNKGLIATLNEALSMARGELIARMDADDLCHPERLARQVAAFRAAPQLGMCGTDFHVIDRGRGLYAPRLPAFPDEDLPILSLFFTAFRHSTIMFNRSVLGPDLLRYDPAYVHAEDFDLFRRITAAHATRIIHEPLLAYRVHDQSVTITASQQMRRSHLRIVSENLQRLGSEVKIAALLQLSADPGEALEEMVNLAAQVLELPTLRPASERTAFEQGCRNFFFFLRAMALDEFGYSFAAQFLERTRSWALMRRREAYLLRMFKGVPALGDLAWRCLERIDRRRAGIHVSNGAVLYPGILGLDGAEAVA